MPSVEKAGVQTIKEQIDQWEGVMHDPNIDGFNGYYCKQKLYSVLWLVQEAIKDAPKYHGEEEFLEQKKPL